MYSVVLMMALTGSAETPEFGCRGCHGCAGRAACHGGLFNRCSGSHGCHGGLFNRCQGCHGRAACHGCHGGLLARRCHGCTGGCAGSACHGCTGAGKTEKKEEMPKKEKAPSKTDAPATIVVNLPANARLTIDGNVTTSISERRTFVTPALEVGGEYFYLIRAEILRDGQSVTETQHVTVRAGQVTEINFPTQTVAVSN